MMKEYWRLTILHSGTTCEVVGSEEVLKAATEEWLEYQRADEVTAELREPMLVIDGHSDSYDRAPVRLILCLRDITSMCLMRMT